MSVNLTLNGVAFASPSTPGFTPGMRVVVTVALTVSPATIALIDAQKGGELVANIAPTSVTYRTTAGVLLGTGPTTAVPVKFHALQRARPTAGRLVTLSMPGAFYAGAAYCSTFGTVGAAVVDGDVTGVTVPADPLWSNVSLLLRMNGADMSTAFIDSGPIGVTVTPAGNARIRTNTAAAGGAWGEFDGTGDWLTVPFSTGINLTGVEFQVEGTCRVMNAVPRFQTLLDFRGSGTFSSSWSIGIDTVSRSLFVYNGVTAATIFSTSVNALPTIGSTFRWAVVRAGTTMYLFVNGVPDGTVTWNPPATHVSGLRIGASQDGTGGFVGFMEEIRITRGAARNVTAYTPIVGEFPSNAPVVNPIPPGGGDVGGLFGRYYNNLDLVGLPVWSGKEVPFVQFSRFSTTEWKPGLGVPNVTGGGMSARWTGFVRVPTSGKWQFQCNMDDGGKFFFQGQTVFDRWEAGVGQVNSGWLDLEANVDYPVWLEYLNYVADAYYDFRWQTQVGGNPTGMVQVPAGALSASLAVEPTRTIVLNSGHFVTPVNRY